MVSDTANATEKRLAFFLLKPMNRAVREFGLIRKGDRIAVAVSGGKDSLALLRLLRWRQKVSGEDFTLAAIHVRGDAGGITPLHEPLARWLSDEGVPFRIVVPELVSDETILLNCQRCTWLRRKALFTAAGELGCNVVAYAHHADDAAQTTLLNLLYSGSARTLAPCAQYFGGRFRLVRPLFYAFESELRRFAAACDFPSAPPPCTRAADSRRERVRDILKILGRDYLLHVRSNLIRGGLQGLTPLP